MLTGFYKNKSSTKPDKLLKKQTELLNNQENCKTAIENNNLALKYLLGRKYLNYDGNDINYFGTK